MSEMIEVVTRALMAEAKRQLDGQPIPGLPASTDSWSATGNSLDMSLMARAALEAMRTPTDEMVEAGRKAITGYPRNETIVAVHQSMIDAALTHTKEDR